MKQYIAAQMEIARQWGGDRQTKSMTEENMVPESHLPGRRKWAFDRIFIPLKNINKDGTQERKSR